MNRRAVTWIAACASMLASCGGDDGLPGQLVVAVTTDMVAPRDFDLTTITVEQDGAKLFEDGFSAAPGENAFPATLALTQGSDPHSVTRVRVHAKAGDGLEQEVESKLDVTVPTDRVGVVFAEISWACVGVSCDAGETCVAGTCAPVEAIDVETLADYDIANVEERECFDVIFCTSTNVEVTLSDCSFPRPAAEQINVSLSVPRDMGVCTREFCRVVLDRGTEWIDEGNTIRIAPGICDQLETRVEGVLVSTGNCDSKTVEQTVCTQGGAPGGMMMGPPPGGGM